MEKNENESFLSFCSRVTKDVKNKKITYEDWSKAVFGDCLYSDETLRRVAKIFGEFIDKLTEESIAVDSKELLEKIRFEKEELLKERKKIQTANIEYHANLRNDARGEMLDDRIVEAIHELQPFKVISSNKIKRKIGVSGLLCLSDFHAGSCYEVNGMYGEIVNQYNFEIMEARLWKLLDDICLDKIDIDNLVVACLGDYFENILRISSLTKLKEPVVDTIIKFSEFMATWLVECHNRLGVPIKVLFVGGNHDNARLLTSKPIDDRENFGKLVQKFIEIRTNNIENIEIAPYTDVAIENIQNNNLMFVHGTDRNLKDTIEYFCTLYNIDCDAIYAGHLHSPESKTIGIAEVGDREIFRCGSICGVDPYAKSIRQSSRPSALFALYSEDGRGWSKNYYLG